MSDEKEQEQEQKQKPEVQALIEPGTMLKQKREKLGLTQDYIANRLRLKVYMIDDFESNQFDPAIDSVYLRGYLSNYAKLVELKESKVLYALEELYPDAAGKNQYDMRSFSDKTKHAQHDSRITTITWAVLVIIVGISAVWWWQNQKNDVVEYQEEPVIEEIIESTQTVTEPHDELDSGTERLAGAEEIDAEAIEEVQDTAQEEPKSSDAGEQASSNDSATNRSSSAENETAEESVTAVSKEAAESVAEKDNSDNTPKLVMNFEGDCWIQVKDATGKTLSVGVKKPGQTLNLDGKAPYKVILGAPEVVSISFNGESVDLSGYTSGKVARLTLSN
ncbi:cytoskeleton protein RodZ [Vibrio sp.]|nr:cytoskeleton protein RodZ [Vibrio sp.]